jgi:hypothetical protein
MSSVSKHTVSWSKYTLHHPVSRSALRPSKIQRKSLLSAILAHSVSKILAQTAQVSFLPSKQGKNNINVCQQTVFEVQLPCLSDLNFIFLSVGILETPPWCIQFKFQMKRHFTSTFLCACQIIRNRAETCERKRQFMTRRVHARNDPGTEYFEHLLWIMTW